MGLSTPGKGLGKSKLELANAKTEDVINGKKFYAGDKVIKTGTLVDKGAITDLINLSNDGKGYIYARIPKGAYRTSASGGYPEIKIPNHAAIAALPGGDKGVEQIGGGIAQDDNFVYIQPIPEGYYHNDNPVNTWNPRVKVPRQKMFDMLGGDRGAWAAWFVGSRISIPQGYHNGQGWVDVAGGNHGAWGTTIDPGGSVVIPQGYHDGQGRIYARPASDKVRTTTVQVRNQSFPYTYTAPGTVIMAGATYFDSNLYLQITWSGNQVYVTEHANIGTKDFDMTVAYYI